MIRKKIHGTNYKNVSGLLVTKKKLNIFTITTFSGSVECLEQNQKQKRKILRFEKLFSQTDL